MDSADVLVLGAGIQGVCVALALAGQGHRVRVVDRAADCMQRASLRNEGKIHLGFVYANDPSGRTPELMLDGAMAFGDLLEHWVGRKLPWGRLRSRPFTYLVLEDSMVPPEAIFAAYAQLDRAYEVRGPARYLGMVPDRLWEEVDPADLDGSVDPDRVVAAVRTAEAAVHPGLVRQELRAALHAHPLITVEYGHQVREAQRGASGFVVSGARVGGTTWTGHVPTVVNCLWGDRIALDAELGIAPDRPWAYRLKYRVLGCLAEAGTDLPSLTMVLGRFGDVVVHPGQRTYLSWYPTCLAGWDAGLAPPAAWDAACSGDDRRAEAQAIGHATVAALASIVPRLGGFRVESVDAGVIVAWGSSDIDDPTSELHERHAIGVREEDGWFSIDTGKFTTAPLFAQQLAELVGPRR